MANAPQSDIDFFADSALENPYPLYRTLRDTAPAVYLTRYQVWFTGRYDSVRAALGNWQTYSSAHGIGLNPIINAAWANALICVDPPVHSELRKLFTERLSPRHLKPVEATIDRRANELAERLVERGRFDAVTHLAHDLPVNVIEEWERLRTDTSLIERAFHEIVRIESPIQNFSRVATKDVDVGDGVVIPRGARVIVSYGSANRDERHFDEPERFDVMRRRIDHLGFGLGNHACAGQGLARLEAHAVFRARAPRVRHFELTGEPIRALNNITRGFSHLPARIP